MRLLRFSPRPRRPKLFLVRRVVGDSMLPALRPGKVVVAWSPVRIKPDHVVVLRHDGLEKIKRVNYVRGNEVFVVGDNESASTDSRNFGPISRSDILARVIWPAV